MEENLDWLNLTILGWKNQNIELGKGTSLEIISQAENILNYDFPESFKSLYLRANGFKNFDWTDNMISIWPIERILEEHGKHTNFIGFGDFLINSILYGFKKNQTGIFKNYDLDPAPLSVRIADNLEDFMTLIIDNSDLLY